MNSSPPPPPHSMSVRVCVCAIFIPTETIDIFIGAFTARVARYLLHPLIRCLCDIVFSTSLSVY